MIALLRAQREEGTLSSGELDERIELAYRARTLGELDDLAQSAAVAPHLQAQVLLAHGLATPTTPKRKRSFLERQLIYSGGVFLFWVVVWAVTGMGLIWFLLLVLTTAAGFTLRIARGERRSGLLRRPSRARAR